ncbi:MAG: TVP38/TMEM64 family inner membrane protein YdjZ [Chloroflexi bacterium ADurb.Bin360]|nr:MAG: TVP38/TMEM64 family inner membrane protein YdjZ [Chloroflexi bacterium ADurb.Bin360]
MLLNNSPTPVSRPAHGGFRSPRFWLLIAIIILGLLVTLDRWVPVVLLWLEHYQDRVWVEAAIRRWGVWAPLASIGLNVLQVLLAPIPGHIFAPLNGYLFGPVWGIVYSVVGVQLGSMLAMGLSRVFGRRLAERFTGAALLESWDRLVHRWGILLILLVFALPLLPDDVMCFVAGLTDIPLRRLFIWTLLARFPGVAAAVLLGDRALRLPLGILVTLGLGLLGLSWFVLHYHRTIQAWFLWRFRRYFRH